MEVNEEKFFTYNRYFGWSLLVVLSVEELYPSPPLGVDSVDTSQLPMEKNLHGQFQYFQITQPGSSRYTSVP